MLFRIILSPSQEVESNVRVDIEKKKGEEREFRMRRQRRVNDNNNTNDLLDLCKLPLFVLLDEDKNETKLKRPYLTKPLTHKGQLLRVRSHLEMQSR